MDASQKYKLQLADTAQIQSHRLQQTVGNAPELEIEMALCNVGLDLLGQCRYLYQMIGEQTKQSEDQIAMGRDEREMYNLLIAELPNEDFAQIVAKNFLLSHYSYLVYQALQKSTSLTLKAIADKSLTELEYHIEYFDNWVIRLGDGTDYSKEKMQSAIDRLWEYTGEFFIPSEYEKDLDKTQYPIDLLAIKKAWNEVVSQTLKTATLQTPEEGWAQTGGKSGVHSEHMAYILTETRYMQSSYPDMQW